MKKTENAELDAKKKTEIKKTPNTKDTPKTGATEIKKKKSKYEPGDFAPKPKKSSAGLGLFATKEIPKDVCIIEYFGRTISEEEEYTSRSKYLFEINSKRTIDGTDRKNIARYINHSCKPNCEPTIHKGQVFIFSLRKINPGEELTYNYGKEYWNSHIKPYGCRCAPCTAKRELAQKTK